MQFLHPVFGPTDKDHAEGLRADQDRRWLRHSKDPASRWIYVEAQGTGEVLGGCEWLLYKSDPFPDGVQYIEAG